MSTRKIFFRFITVYPYFCSLNHSTQRELKITRKKKIFFFRFFSKCRNATWVFFRKNGHCELYSDPRGLKISLGIVFGTLFLIPSLKNRIQKKWKKNCFVKILDLTDLVSLVQNFEKKFFFYFLGVRPWIWKSIAKNIPRLIFSPLGSLESSQWRFFRKKTHVTFQQKLLSSAF